jgi:hypothetical protein
MTYPDPANPKHWIYNADGTRTPKPKVEYLKDLINDPTPTINIVNNTNTFDMGDNGIVQLGNGNTITNPSKKSILDKIIDSVVNHAVAWILGVLGSLAMAAIAYWH